MTNDDDDAFFNERLCSTCSLALNYSPKPDRACLRTTRFRLCPRCLGCFQFEDGELEEEEETNDDDFVGVRTMNALAKKLTGVTSERDHRPMEKRRVITCEDVVLVDVAMPQSVAFRFRVCAEIRKRRRRRQTDSVIVANAAAARDEDEYDDDDEKDEDDADEDKGDFGKQNRNSATMKRNGENNNNIDSNNENNNSNNNNNNNNEDALTIMRSIAIDAVRSIATCKNVMHTRDKQKATVTLFLEYENVPSSKDYIYSKDGVHEARNDDDDNKAKQIDVIDDFRAMKAFNIKRPNDRQKNLKKRKRREDKKPHWELALSQPDPKWGAAFEDARLEYARVYKETSTSGFSSELAKASTETLMSALFNNTYKAIEQRQINNNNKLKVRIRAWASPVYVAGRYAKFARNVPQSPWSNCPVKWARGTESVQDALEAAILEAAKADGAKFNSSGREDLDVRMLGDGRPFVLELHNPKANVNELIENLKQAEVKMNEVSFMKTDVKAYNLRVVPKETYKSVGLRLEGNEKEKSYSCVCVCTPPIPMDSNICETISLMKELELKQQTPIRVSHRRSDLVRSRTLREITVSIVPGTRGRVVFVEMRSEAGTYIKEFCHGDDGRTVPSLGDLFGNGTKCEIIQLDVTKVDAFGFE